MHRNEHTVEIDSPAEAVFPYLASGEKRLEWMEKLVESTQLSAGAPGLGTRFRDVFEDHGQRIEINSEIVDWEPNSRLATRLHGNAFQATGRQRLEERDGRTRLTTVIETEYTAPLVRLMARVVTRHAQNQLEADHARLKRLVETGATGATGSTEAA